MSILDDVLNAIDEQTIAQKIELRHDEFRQHYQLRSLIVRDTQEFWDETGRYYADHFAAVVAPGAKLSPAEANGRVRQILEGELRRTGRTLLNLLADARDGRNSGLAGVLNMIANGIKEESVENEIEDVFSRFVDMDSWPARVSIMREFLTRYGHMLPTAITSQPPERYASEWKQLIRQYVEAKQRMASGFRRI